MSERIVTAAMMLVLLLGCVASDFAQTLPQATELQITTRPRAQHVTEHSAIIRWNTNIPASSLVRYGTDPDHLSQTTESAGEELVHTIELYNLRSCTVYYYQVVSSTEITGTSVISLADRFITHGEFVLYDTEPYKPHSR